MKLKSWIEVIKETFRIVPERAREDHLGFHLLQENGTFRIFGDLRIMEAITEKLKKEVFYYEIGNSIWALFTKRETVKGSFGVYILWVDESDRFSISIVNTNETETLNQNEDLLVVMLKDILYQTFPHRLEWLLQEK